MLHLLICHLYILVRNRGDLVLRHHLSCLWLLNIDLWLLYRHLNLLSVAELLLVLLLLCHYHLLLLLHLQSLKFDLHMLVLIHIKIYKILMLSLLSRLRLFDSTLIRIRRSISYWLLQRSRLITTYWHCCVLIVGQLSLARCERLYNLIIRIELSSL